MRDICRATSEQCRVGIKASAIHAFAEQQLRQHGYSARVSLVGQLRMTTHSGFIDKEKLTVVGQLREPLVHLDHIMRLLYRLRLQVMMTQVPQAEIQLMQKRPVPTPTDCLR